MNKRSQGFTLMELMIVLVIIGILAASFAAIGGDVFGKSQDQKTKSRLHALTVMIENYRSLEGEYPDDRLPSGLTTNRHNEHSEALVLALFDPEYTGERPSQEWLVNTDADEAARAPAMFDSRELFEIGDVWGNPIVYFESLHYADKRGAVLQAGIEFYEEQTVMPGRNERTGSYAEPNGFQLVSAGGDGLFGTEDDLYSYQD